MARRPVLLIAGAVGVLLTLVSDRYGYFGDELYLIAAGRRPAWGYADGPPLVPALAAAVTALSDTLVALRIAPMLATTASIVMTALLAREFGGGRRAQVLAALAYPTSTFLLSTGHLFYPATFDVLLWTVAAWLLVRWVRGRADATGTDRPLVLLGLVVAVTLQVKYLILGPLVLVLVAAAVDGPRDLLRRRALWLGAAIAVAAAVPGLVWQASHGWPQAGVAGSISGDGGVAGRVAFLPLVAVTAGLVTGVTLAVHGLWALLRDRALRPYRFLGWASLAMVIVVMAVGGRPYYLAGLFPLLWAVAASRLEHRRAARWWRWAVSRPVIVLSLLYAVTALPVFPLSWQGDGSGPVTAGSVGWPELAGAVAGAVRDLPPDQRATAVIVAETYWQASALDLERPRRGLPPVYSGDRGFAFFGRPAESTGTVLWVGLRPDPMRPYFASMRLVASSPSPLGTHRVWVCTGRTRSWASIWPEYRNL